MDLLIFKVLSSSTHNSHKVKGPVTTVRAQTFKEIHFLSKTQSLVSIQSGSVFNTAGQNLHFDCTLESSGEF